MKYQLADLVNGQYGEVFTDKEVADQAYADAVAEGKRINLENSGGESDMGCWGGKPQSVEDFISLVEIPDQVSLENWKEEFKKLSQEYMSGINWETVIFENGEFAQAAGDIQLEAYKACLPDDSDVSLDDWEFYAESCDPVVDFQFELKERYESVDRA